MSVFDDSERTESTPSPTFARGRRGAVKIIISEGVGSAEKDISTNSKRQTSSEPPTQTKGALASEQDENLVKYSSEDKQGPGISSEENAEKEKNELRQRESANENVEQIKANSSLFRNKAKTPFARFRSVAKTVQHNLQWTKPPSKEEESKAFVVQHSEGGEPKTLTFNAGAFKANIQSVQDLSEDVKRLLQVQSWNRTDKDVNRLFSIVKRLKCFDKYPSVVKKELSRVLYYETFEEGRVVVQQGQPGMSFYFILSGTVSVEVKEADKVTGESHRQVIGELGPGASFGELALLHNSKRTATIVCKGNCEFLRVDKPDFDMVLRLSHEQGWEKRLAAIKSLDIFKNWSEAEQKAACDRAKLHEYSSNTLVLSDVKYSTENIYVIVSGKCKIVREYSFLHAMAGSRAKITLPPIDNNENVLKTFRPSKNEKLRRHLLEMCTIGKGHYFGVGEDLRKTHIIAINKVECLLINKVVFSRHDRGKTLDDMKYAAATLLPNRERAFRLHLDNRRWLAYKRKLINEILESRGIALRKR